MNGYHRFGWVDIIRFQQVAQNVRVLKERYDKPVLIVETGYYNDRALEANQWLCDFLLLLIDAGASGLYYWEPELADDYDLGAWNPFTRKPSIVLDAFLGLRHSEELPDAVNSIQADVHDSQTQYFTPDGIRIASPQRGLNIVRVLSDNVVRTYKVLVR